MECQALKMMTHKSISSAINISVPPPSPINSAEFGGLPTIIFPETRTPSFWVFYQDFFVRMSTEQKMLYIHKT